MDINTQDAAVSNGGNNSNSERTFTQSELNTILSKRLGEQANKHEHETEALRSEFRSRSGITQPNSLDDLVAADAQAKSLSEGRRAYLGQWFGRNASPKAANELFRRDPAEYNRLRSEAQKLDLVYTPPEPENKGRFHGPLFSK